MWGPVLGGATIFGAIMAIVTFLNGRSTKRYIERILMKMDEMAEQRHREVMETAEQRHREVIELLKKGFGGK